MWDGLCSVLEKQQLGRWIAPDLSGHGASPWRMRYSVGQLAADVAAQTLNESSLIVIGHSLGVYVGLALASGWFGADVVGVLGIGPKISWPAADIQIAGELAARPVKWYESRQEALARYRKVSGLSAEIAPHEEPLARGITESAGRWRLAQDPRTFEVAGAPFESLATRCAAPVVLARGAADPMVSLQELRAHSSVALQIAGAGHNVHVEKPQAVVALLEHLAPHA